MNPIILNPFLFYFFIAVMLFLSAIALFFAKEYCKQFTHDLIIFLDKSNRWFFVREKLLGINKYKHHGKEYLLMENCGVVNTKGKALYMFSENKPQPMKLEYNNSKWVTSDSMMSILNNELIQKLVNPSNSLKDSLILFGAIGGIIAGIASVLIMLKQFGVI